jgi:hypothetical protein
MRIYYYILNFYNTNVKKQNEPTIPKGDKYLIYKYFLMHCDCIFIHMIKNDIKPEGDMLTSCRLWTNF